MDLTPRRREDETDADGHRWHSRGYVAEWIRAHDEGVSAEKRRTHRERTERILEAIPYARDARIDVLDLGAGWGRLAQAVLEWFPRARLVGLDFSRPMLERATSHLAAFGERVRLVEGDLEQPGSITSLERRFHVVVTSATLHHLRGGRYADLYREIHAALEPGGVFANLDRARSTRLRARLTRLLNRSAAAHDATLREHVSRLEGAGFDVRHEAVGTWFLMVATKDEGPEHNGEP